LCAGIECLERPVWRIQKWLRAKIETALLERHEACRSKEASAAT